MDLADLSRHRGIRREVIREVDLASYFPSLSGTDNIQPLLHCVLKDGKLDLKESLVGLALYVSITFALYSLGLAPSH